MVVPWPALPPLLFVPPVLVPVLVSPVAGAVVVSPPMLPPVDVPGAPVVSGVVGVVGVVVVPGAVVVASGMVVAGGFSSRRLQAVVRTAEVSSTARETVLRVVFCMG
jgi:hypothetical protein